MSEEKTGIELLFSEWFAKSRTCEWKTPPPQFFCLFSGSPCNFWGCFKRTLEEVKRRQKEMQKTDEENKNEVKAIVVSISEGAGATTT